MKSPTALQCPLCRCGMLPVEGYPGQWVCALNPAHLFDEDGVVPEPYREGESKLKPMGPNPLMDRATGGADWFHWWQGATAEVPLSTVPQSNVGDGSMNHGPNSKGGGSKSGRKRKKTKGGKKFTDSPWDSEGATNRK